MPSLLDQLEAEARAEMESQRAPLTREDLARALGMSEMPADYRRLPNGMVRGPVTAGLAQEFSDEQLQQHLSQLAANTQADQIHHQTRADAVAQDEQNTLGRTGVMAPIISGLRRTVDLPIGLAARGLESAGLTDSASVDQLMRDQDAAGAGGNQAAVGAGWNPRAASIASGVTTNVAQLLTGGPALRALGLGAKATQYAIPAVFGLSEGNQAITEGRDAGMRGTELAGFAARAATIEAVPAMVFSRLGLGGFERTAAGGEVARGMLRAAKNAGLSTAQELPEELLTEVGHYINRVASTDQTFSWENLGQTAMDTAIQTVLTGGLLHAPGVIQAGAEGRQARKDEQGQAVETAKLLAQAEQDRALAHVPADLDPAATIKAGPPIMDTAEREAMRADLAAAGRPTPPGLDPAHAIPDDSPMAETDPLLNFDPEQIGKLARADMMTPPTVELSQAPTGPVDAVSDPEATAQTQPITDAEDFDRFLAERGLTAGKHAELSNQSADLAPFVPGDEQAVVVGSSKIAGQGIIAKEQMGPGAGIVAMTSEGKRTPAGRFVNHSARPNARAVLTDRGLEIVPTRAVEPGEELTISYRQARGPAMELGRRIAADPARAAQPASAPAPAPVQPAEDHVARHRKLTAELSRWMDKEALARGEGKTGAGRAANARKNGKGVQKLIDGLEARMTPAELAQVRPQVAPEPAQEPAQAPQPAPKAPPTPAAAPPEAAPRQIERERPSRASSAQPEAPAEPYSGMVPGSEIEPGRWSVIGTDGRVAGYVRAATYAQAAAKAATGVTDENAKGERPRPIPAAARMEQPAAVPADLESARVEVARLETEQAKLDVDDPQWAVVDDRLSAALSRRDAAEKAADPIGYRVRRLEANASRFRAQLEKARTEDRQHLQDQLDRIEQALAEIRDEQAAAAKPAKSAPDAWTPFPASSGTLGIPRASMPQVSGDKRGALANYLRARGITWEDAEVAPKDLRPSQAEFNPAKVAAAAKSLAKDGDPARAILVSSDNRIIDGHHQALAMQQADPDTPVRVIRIGAPAREAIDAINGFPSSERASGAAPANVPAVPDGSPALPGPQDTPLGRVMTAPTSPEKLAGMTTEQRTQLLADARMLAQVAKPKSKTANKARLLTKSLEKIAKAEADAKSQASAPAVASPPTPNPEDQPHADRATPADDRRAPDVVGTPPGAGGRATSPGPDDSAAGRRDDGRAAQPGRVGAPADGTDAGRRDGVRSESADERVIARGDTHPKQDERLAQLLERGEPVAMQPGESLSALVRGYVEDRIPAFSVEGKMVRNEHDAAALLGALRSPYVERLSALVVGPDGTVRRSCIISVGTANSADVPQTLADLEAATGQIRPDDIVYTSHNHPSGDPKPSPEDAAVYANMERLVQERGASFRGIVTNGKRFYWFASGTATPLPRTYDAPAAYEAMRYDDRAPLVVHGPEKVAEVVRLVQTNPEAVVLYALTSRARVQAVQVYAGAPTPEQVENDVRELGAVQALLATANEKTAMAMTLTMPNAPTVKDIIVADTEARSLRLDGIYHLKRTPKQREATGDKLNRAAFDEEVEYGADLNPRKASGEQPNEDAEPTPPTEQTSEDTAVAAELVQSDAQQEQADSAAMQAPAEPINDLPAVPPAPGGAMSHMADALNAQPTGALGFLSPLVGAVKLANGAVQWWSQPLIERVEHQAGEHGKEVARMARAANDRTRQLIGQASSVLTPALKLMSGRSSAARAAVRNLRSVEWSADGKYGFSRFQNLVENADSLERLAPAERAMVEKYRALVDMTGQWAENAQFKVYTGENPDGTPTWLLFQRTPDGRKFIRRPTQELHDLMQRPGSPEFEQLANALADANGMERPKVFQRLREESERAIILRQPLESTRWLKLFPTHIRINGRNVPLLESDPFLAAQHIVRGTAMRVGYVEQFGQDVATAATPSEHPAVKAWVHAGGDPAAFIDLSRSLNGMPVDQSPRLAPGSPEYDLVRTMKATLGVIRTGLLSKAAIVNIPESLGNTLAFVGGKRWLAAWADLMTQPRVAATEMARMGARTEDVANLMGQEGRKRESLERIIRDVGLRVTLFQGVNEVNELHAALAGLHFAKDLAAGRTSGIDAERMRLLGFTDAEVVQLMSRTAPPKLLEAVATRMAEATQGSTSLPSERAKAAHNRAWNLLVAFDSYGQMKLNRLARVHRAMLDAVREKNPDKLLNAAKIAAGFYAGTAASGTVALFLAALAMGGASGLKQLWEQAEDHPVDLAGDALRYAMLGGAAASVVNAAGAAADGGDQFAEALTRMSLPVSLVQEIAELANGAGRYRDQDMDEKAVTFLRSHLPISRPIATLAAAIGVAYSDPGRETAMSAYWKWRREHTRMVAAYGQDESEDQAHTRFRVAMRRAVTELRAGKDPSTHLAEALSAKSEQPQEKGKPKPLSAVVASIKARRLLATLKDEERTAVTKEIGPTATSKLEAWDALLGEWAERMKATVAN